MSLVRYYKCDICNKKYHEKQLMNFTRKREVKSAYVGLLGQKFTTTETEIKDFDMCEKCYERIRSEFKKEGETDGKEIRS